MILIKERDENSLLKGVCLFLFLFGFTAVASGSGIAVSAKTLGKIALGGKTGKMGDIGNIVI